MASETRGRTIPRVAWWCDLATDAVARAGVTRDQLAVELRERFGYVTDETGVSRCLSGKVLTIQLAQHISAILQIPPPVIIPTSEAEAWALLGRREVARVHAQVAVLSAQIEERHPDPVGSSHGAGRKPKRGRLGDGR